MHNWRLNRYEIYILCIIIMLALFLRVMGIWWGVPSSEKASFFYQYPASEAYNIPEIGEALHSYHADEPKILQAISNMNPSEFDLNPHLFIYPTLYIYMVAGALEVASIFNMIVLNPLKEFYFLYPDQMGKFYLIGRIVTVILGLLTVYITYIIGKRMYNKWVGIIAGLILALLPLHVVHSKYMSVDVPTTFWIVLSVLCAIRIEGSRGYKWYILSGLTAGLATATKYYAILVVISIFMAHYLNSHNGLDNKCFFKVFRNNRIAIVCIMTIAGFFIGSPYVFLSPTEFYSGAILHHIDSIVGGEENYDMIYGHFKYPFLFHVYASLFIGMGPFLWFLALAGVAYSLIRHKKSDLIIFSFIIPYYLMIGISFLRPMRYSIPLLPFMAIVSARLIFDIYQSMDVVSWKKIVRGAYISFMGLIMAYTLMDSLAYGLMMSQKDNRDKAAKWIIENVDKRSTIGITRAQGFFSVPLNPNSYQIKVIGFDRQLFKKVEPDYFVMSEFEYREFLRLRTKYPKKAEFIDQLVSGKFQFNDFKYDTIWFESRPKISGLDFGHRYPPHDWLYPFPKVVILKKERL
ncbi:MAG: ArnT family glycosyltransferase [Candidatus Scalinduaceae bacterium]